MLVLITYDVSTEDKEGQRRLRRVAQACKNFGLRVQKSVFECHVGESQLVELRHHLISEMDRDKDSIRIYPLDALTKERIEHYGIGEPVDPAEPFVV